MSDDRTTKTVVLGKPDGRRKTEGPKWRWLACTEESLILMGVKRWRKTDPYGKKKKKTVIDSVYNEMSGSKVNALLLKWELPAINLGP
jgi:hypothetical protein